MSLLLQQQQGSSAGMDFNTRGSLGLGTLGTPGITSAAPTPAATDQMNMLRQTPQAPAPAAPAPSANAGSGNNADIKSELLKGQQEQAELEAKLQKLKDDIAKRQKEADELEASSSGDKKRENEGTEDQSNKRPKTDGQDGAAS